MTDYSAELARILPGQTHTIARHNLPNGQIVWVRQTGKTIPQWRYSLLGFVARHLRLGALQPVPNAGGSEAIATEAAHDIRAPRLLAESAGGLMFTHIGDHTLLHHIENSPERLDYWQQGLAAIALVHRSGQYLSQAFARNIIVCNDGQIGFIDFEDDPGRYMPLERCQSRDYLCYLQSSAVWLQKHGLLDQAAAIWRQHAAALRTPIESAIRPIGWMRHLQAGFWGNDTLRLAALAALFEQEK